MTEGMRQWVIGICCASVACTLLELLQPIGEMQKAARFIIALFFLAVLVAPIGKWDTDFPTLPDMEQQDVTAQTDTMLELMQQQVIAAGNAQIRYAAERTITEIGVQPQKITPHIYENADGAAELSVLEVILLEKDRMYAETIRLRLYDTFGIKPDIRFVAADHTNGSAGGNENGDF